MQNFDLHIHTNYSDGDNSPEEMVQRAIELGLARVGISDHSYTSCDESYCMPKERYPEYIRTIGELKKKYADKIEVLCGIEQDLFADLPSDGFDYSIGSVHYLKLGEEYYCSDHVSTHLMEAAEKYFDGDIYALIEEYYRLVSTVADVLHPDIIGHFDVISKYAEKQPIFDLHHPRYVAAWKKAADILIPYGIPFEINTGAISRGVRTTPYPSDEIIAYIKEKGGRFILSSDAHSVKAVTYLFNTLNW